MDPSEILFLIIVPLVAMGLALWLCPRSPSAGFLLWPLGVPAAAGVAVVIAYTMGAHDLAGALLVAVCPIASTLLAVTAAGLRRRPWALVVAIPLLYALAAIVAINVGLELGVLSL